MWAKSTSQHYSDAIKSAIVSQITSLTIVCSTVYSDADQRKHQSSASLAFVRGIHRSPVNSPHKWPVARKMFPFDDVIMKSASYLHWLIVEITFVQISGVCQHAQIVSESSDRRSMYVTKWSAWVVRRYESCKLPSRLQWCCMIGRLCQNSTHSVLHNSIMSRYNSN